MSRPDFEIGELQDDPAFVPLPDGIELYVETVGSGRPIVLVHGLFGLTDHWQKQIPVLARHGKVIAYDFRGSGRSSKPHEPYSIEQHADDLRALLEALDVIEPVIVFGHSLGCSIAIEYAHRHPDGVSGLCLIGGSADGSEIGADWDTIGHLISRRASLVPLFERVSFGPELRFNPEGEHIRRWTSLEAARLPTYAVEANSRALREYVGSPKLASLPHQALVVVGEADETAPAESVGRRIADGLPRGRLEVLSGGHFVMLENPTSFNELTTAFVDEVPRGAPAATGNRPVVPIDREVR